MTLAVILGLLRIASAQDPEEQTPSQARIMPAAVNNARGLSQDYRVGIGDTLEIQVIEADTLNQMLRVSSAGDINFLPVGPIHVLDLSAAELEAKIASVLQEAKLIQKPEVLVFVQDYQAKRIYASGELARPGEFVMSQNMTVLDAILLAGGVTSIAAPHAYLHRRTSDAGASGPPPPNALQQPDTPREGTEIVKVDLQPMLDGGIPEPDLTLRHGDALIVPRRHVNFFYVLGAVMRPLNYVYPFGRTLMASQALAGAGGPTKTARMSEGIVARYAKDGKREEMKVDFAAILEGRQPDFPVQPNDIIFIPGSMIKEIGEGFVFAANAMIEGTAFRIGRSYQLPDAPNPNEP
jgi:polysaccharide export outer membrane protein